MKNQKFLSNIKETFFKQKSKLILYVFVKILKFSIAIIIPLLFAAFIDNLVNDFNKKNFLFFAYSFTAISLFRIVLKHFDVILNTNLDATSVFMSSQTSIKNYFAGSLDILSQFESAYMSTRIISDTRSVVTFFLNNLVELILGVLQGISIP